MQSESCLIATSQKAVEPGYRARAAKDAPSTYAAGGCGASEIIERFNEDLAGVASLLAARDFNF